MKFEEIKDAIQILFNFKIIEETESKVLFNLISDKKAFLLKEQVNNIIEELTLFSTEQDVELFNSNSYEILVRDEIRVPVSKDVEQNDAINKIEYKIAAPSDRYLIFFIHNLSKQNTPKILRGGIIPYKLRKIFDRGEQQNLPYEPNVIDVIKEIVPRLETLQISSGNAKRKPEFEQLIYAFLFNLGYNLDYTFLPLRFMDEFTQPYRIGHLRRANFSDLEPPKRIYLNELILHYQKGISSESIDHQFLSFYHVLEHFFEKIYNDDILNSIKSELTKPNFSYKRNKDVAGLISLIQNRLKYKNDEFQLNELEALELTLKKFVRDLPFLSSELITISSTLVEYFKTTEVSFSRGNKVNFESTNTNEIYVNLAKRIYLTRNSIVHSKETDKSKYTPFRDDQYLTKEIYLLRLIAEIVIIDNSKEL
ncbi:hypothetical protein [Chitinophaga sp. S165]|uniref:hypothetical protein n=1 Tax=Chitinophaga sp. S165 TaxID=2135462 RepID=UPI000D709680|nr:hypothetical protein [Chitinophaga sp. S165]PWV46449.1 hypothetical protein C7475_1109 [Chitinophaga sp. S165]